MKSRKRKSDWISGTKNRRRKTAKKKAASIKKPAPGRPERAVFGFAVMDELHETEIEEENQADAGSNKKKRIDNIFKREKRTHF